MTPKKLQRLRRISWKSKNNVYLYKSTNNLSDFINDNKIDILVLPSYLYIDESYNENIRIIRVGIKGEDKEGILIDKNIAKELSNDIGKIDGLNVGEYAGASAVYCISLSEGYTWENILILTL